MPITPHFRLTQDEEHLWVDVQVPHVKVSRDSVEVVIEDECRMHFYASPYLLVLTFPHLLHDADDHISATWDPIQGSIRLTLLKQTHQLWPDLDLLANLLQSTKQQQRTGRGGSSGGVVHEIISSSPSTDEAPPVENDEAELQEQNVNNDSDEIDQDPLRMMMTGSAAVSRGCLNVDGVEVDDAVSLEFPRYGFANMFHHVFSDLVREGVVFVDIPEPDTTRSCDRRRLRLEAETLKFDPDRYLQDLDMEDDHFYQCAMEMTPHWNNRHNATTTEEAVTTLSVESEKKDTAIGNQNVDKEDDVDEITHAMSQLNTHSDTQASTSSGSSSHDYFTSDELAKLCSIPYPLLPTTVTSSTSPKVTMELLLGLLDMLYAYVYDHLLTEGEPTVESAWTVSILSCSLSWLDVPMLPDDFALSSDSSSCQPFVLEVLCASLRRTLIYPYLRNFDLGLHCWNEVHRIVRNGRRCILRCLLQLRNILDKSECHYLGNKLFVDPYLAWLQQPRSVTDLDLKVVETQLRSILSSRGGVLSKDLLGLDLARIEDESFQDDTEGDEEDSSDDDTESSSSAEEDEHDEGDEVLEQLHDSHDADHCADIVHAAPGALNSSFELKPVTDTSLLDIETKSETNLVMLAPPADGTLEEKPRVLIQEL